MDTLSPTEASEKVRRLTLDLLKTRSKRDKQVKIGASQIGNPCDYCVGMQLLGIPQPPNRWWMGARIGTSVHTALESEETKHIFNPESYHFEALEGALIERKIQIGVLEGYGAINSSPDLVLTKYNLLVDHKTTTKDKLKKYKLDGVPKVYVYQTQLYAWGLNKSGVKIDTITINFVCRDGLTDDDVYCISFPYDSSYALAAWGRLETIWNYLLQGEDSREALESLSSHEDCFSCSFNGRS